MKMTTEEAFVKVLQMHGIEHAFGIIGSAFMPISDLFPKAGITFWDCAHEGSGGMMADGYTRAIRQDGMMIAQNGPGITNFVTAGEDRLLEPHAAAAGHAAGGQQDHRPGRLPGSRADEAVRGHGRLSGRGARPLAHRRGAEPGDPEGQRASAPGADQRAARFLDPGDRHRAARRSSTSSAPPAARPRSPQAAELLSQAKFPVILNGAGVVLAGAIPASIDAGRAARRAGLRRLSAQRRLPRLAPAVRRAARLQRLEGGDGADRQGRRGACLGTRLNPFSTLPGYGIDYWPKDAKIIQVDINPDRIGLTKKVTVGIVGDAAKVAERHPRAARPTPPATRAATRARPRSPRPSPPGRSSSPRWITRRTIPAPPGTSAPAPPSPTG